MTLIDWVTAGPWIIALIGAGVSILTAKIQHKGKPENALIDQLQEELTRHAGDIAALKVEQNKAKKRELIRDDYITKLREHINAGNPPPPPAWPEGLYD
jgi:hypothetical protein